MVAAVMRQVAMRSRRTARTRCGSGWLADSPAAAALLALAAACSSSNNPADSGGSSDGSSNNPADSGASSDGGGTPTGTAGTICRYTVLSQAAPAASCASPGGAYPENDNNHCVVGGVPVVQETGVCVGVPDAAAPSGGDDATDASFSASGSGDAAAGDDAGGDGGDNGECGESGYADTNYGTSAADDDCKYDVSWTSTPICGSASNVYFTVTVKKRTGADGGASLSDEPPLTGASVSAEVYADDCATIAINSHQTTVEQGNGVYKVGPIEFKTSGKWVVRFHFNECCSDDPVDSPHGHAAFWINVP